MFQIEETVLVGGGYALVSMHHSSDILPKVPANNFTKFALKKQEK